MAEIRNWLQLVQKWSKTHFISRSSTVDCLKEVFMICRVKTLLEFNSESSKSFCVFTASSHEIMYSDVGFWTLRHDR
jgi:hypothetical protein